MEFSAYRTGAILSLMPAVQRVAYTIAFWLPHFVSQPNDWRVPQDLAIKDVFSPERWAKSCQEQAYQHNIERLHLAMEITNDLFETCRTPDFGGARYGRDLAERLVHQNIRMSPHNRIRYRAIPTEDPDSWYGYDLKTISCGSFEEAWAEAFAKTQRSIDRVEGQNRIHRPEMQDRIDRVGYEEA